MQSRQFVQGRWRQEHLSAEVDMTSIGTSHHNHGIAAVVFVESTHGTTHGRCAPEKGWIVHHVATVEGLLRSEAVQTVLQIGLTILNVSDGVISGLERAREGQVPSLDVVPEIYDGQKREEESREG